MPSSRSYPPRSDGPTPGDAAPPAAAARRLRRAREEMLGGAIHAILLAGFAGALGLLVAATLRLFAARGGQQPPWLGPVTVVAIGGLALLVLRRLVARLRDLRDLRREIRSLAAGAAPPDGPGRRRR